MLLARRWKRSLQLGICRGDAIGALYQRQTDTCLLIFKFLQVERVTRQCHPLLQYVTWQLRLPTCRWKRSLQVCCPLVALQKKPFFDGKQALDCHQMYLCLCRWRAGNSTILCVDWHLQRIVVSTQLSFDACEAFPNDRNTHLPCHVRRPLWRPPSGHFFPSLHFIYPSQLSYIWVDAPFCISS